MKDENGWPGRRLLVGAALFDVLTAAMYISALVYAVSVNSWVAPEVYIGSGMLLAVSATLARALVRALWRGGGGIAVWGAMVYGVFTLFAAVVLRIVASPH